MTPTYLHVNTADEVIRAAIAAKYDGVIAGVTSSSNPAKHDWTGFTAVVTAAASAGLKLHVRLSCAGASAKNSDGSASYWAVKYNKGQTWATPHRLPLPVAIGYATEYQTKAVLIVKQIWEAYKRDLADVSAEGGNEAGIGGANCACLGNWSALRDLYNVSFKNAWTRFQKTGAHSDFLAARNYYLQVFPESFWPKGVNHPTPEGFVELAYWKMLRAELDIVSEAAPWLKVFPYSNEGAVGTPGQTEIDSYVGPDASAMSVRFDRRNGFNRYMNTASKTADDCGVHFAQMAVYQASRMSRNPLQNGEKFCTEFGMSSKSSLRLWSSPTSLADGRQSVIGAQRGLTCIVGAGVYRARRDDPLSTEFPIQNNDGSAIGGFLVGPVPVR
jgi:hypothetical protein